MTATKRTSPIRLVPMCFFLSLLLLCAAEVTGWFALLFLLPLALCMLPLYAERLWGFAIGSSLLIAAIVLFLPLPHYVWLAFVCVCAPFVPVRHALRNLKKPGLPTLLSVEIVLLWTAAVLFGLYLLNVHVLSLLPLPLTILAGFALLFFLFLLDAAYQLYLRWYERRVRTFLLPRA